MFPFVFIFLLHFLLGFELEHILRFVVFDPVWVLAFFCECRWNCVPHWDVGSSIVV